MSYPNWQYCTLDQAIKLKALGCPQQSLFFWQKMKKPVPEGCATERLELNVNVGHPISNTVVEENYSAYSSTELGRMLGIGSNYVTMLADNKYGVDVFFGNGMSMRERFINEAEARAALLIKLLEWAVIKIETNFISCLSK